MIAFACRQCGKRFDRPDGTAGTMVFCECGIGNSVPFESTLPPLSVPEAPAPRASRPLDPGGLWQDRASPSPLDPGRYDPSKCFNHPTLPQQQTCVECKLPFCGDCTVALRGETLCGPCKNHRLRRADQPSRLSLMAIFSPVIALAGGIFWIMVMLIALGASGGKGSLTTLGIIGALPQVVALTMGALSLHTIETANNVSGREWAMTGLVASLVSGTLIIVMGLAVPGQ